jgi:hypothetical protein
MRKYCISVVICIVFIFVGCAHNEHMANIEKAKWDAYGQAMAAYYASLPENRGELVDLQVDDTGRLSGLKVYSSDQKVPPAPPEPKEIKPWGSQMVDSVANSKTVDTVAKMAAGVFAIKIISQNAGDDVRDSYNSTSTSNANNRAAGAQVIEGGTVSGDEIDRSNTESWADSGNTQTTDTTENYADSNNTNNSVNDAYNTDNSVNDGYNTDTNNSINDSQNPDNRDNYNNDNSVSTVSEEYNTETNSGGL